MLNPFREVIWRPGRDDLRRFARSLVIGFPCLAVARLCVMRLSSGGWNFQQALWLGGAGALAGLVLLARPGLARPFYLSWYAVACCIGIVVGNVLLATVFYLLVTGTGILRRRLGRSPIQKTCDRRASSYWQDASQPRAPQYYYRQF